MKVQIVVEDGPDAGATYELSLGESYIGREDDCAIRIDDEQVSRRQARITVREKGFLLEDLQSKNGTFLNGLPVERSPLKWGDRIRVGATSFLFLFFRDDKVGTEKDAFRVVRDATSSTVMAAVKVAASPAAARKKGPDPAERERAAEFGNLLQSFREVIQAAKDPRRVPEGFLRKILAASPAERSAIFLLEDPGPTIRILARLSRPGAAADPPFPQALLLQAGREGRGLLARQRIEGEGGPKTHWVACAPFRIPGGMAGVLYADTHESEKVLLRDDLRLLTLAAPFVALSVLSFAAPAARPPAPAPPDEDDLIGSSPAFREVLRTVSAVAPTDATVLVHGESGTGKELVARAIHRSSPRREGPFVPVNCGAIPKDLIESELFGHERGTFTGAHARRIGCFERATRGTLFLDEIAELPLDCQVKMLRSLESRKIQRLGGGEEIPVDVRILAATNKDLEAAVAEGLFRNDLYFRIRVLEITLPPLRERPDDIPALADYCLGRLARKLGRRFKGLDDATRKILAAYPWPGNVRELKNAVERAAVLARDDSLGPEDFAFLKPPAGGGGEPAQSLAESERRAILAALERTGWNKTAAAEALGIDRTTLYDKLKAYGLAAGKVEKG